MHPFPRLAGRAEGKRLILVDEAIWPGRGRYWSHLVSDSSYDELHAFAARIGLPRGAFDRDHYDIPGERRPAALAAGAQPVGSKELVARLTTAGLRRPKHRPNQRPNQGPSSTWPAPS